MALALAQAVLVVPAGQAVLVVVPAGQAVLVVVPAGQAVLVVVPAGQAVRPRNKYNEWRRLRSPTRLFSPVSQTEFENQEE